MDWNGSILIASAVALAGLIVTMRNHKVDFLNQEEQNKKDKISKQLTEFYVPIMTYLHTSKAISRKLFQNKPKDFNILTYLLATNHLFEGNIQVTLTENELKLVDEILALSEKIEDLIIKKGGLLDDKQLTMHYEPNDKFTDVILDEENQKIGLLGLLLSHYKILSYARKGIISGDVDYYDQFKFPREIVSKIEENYKSLKNELDKKVTTYISLSNFVSQLIK